jgi:hypothetical protein
MAGDGMETKQSIPKFLASLVLNPAFSSAQSIDLEPREGHLSGEWQCHSCFPCVAYWKRWHLMTDKLDRRKHGCESGEYHWNAILLFCRQSITFPSSIEVDLWT